MKTEKPSRILKSLTADGIQEITNEVLQEVFQDDLIGQEWESEHPYQGISTPQLPSLGLTPRLPPLLPHCTLEMSPRPIYSTPKIPFNSPTVWRRPLFMTPMGQTPRTKVLSALTNAVTPHVHLTPQFHLSTPRTTVTGTRFSPFVHIRTPSYMTTPDLGISRISSGFTPSLQGWALSMPSPEMPQVASNREGTIKQTSTKEAPHQAYKFSNSLMHELSTPMLFPRQETGNDILEMIENVDDLHLQKTLQSYDVAQVTDNNITDFLMDLSETFMIPPPPVHTTVQESSSERIIQGPIRRGRNTKKMSADIECRIKEDQRIKDKERKEERKKRGSLRKKRFERNESEELKRRVQRGGRTTRSLMKACQHAGIPSNNSPVVVVSPILDSYHRPRQGEFTEVLPVVRRKSRRTAQKIQEQSWGLTAIRTRRSKRGKEE